MKNRSIFFLLTLAISHGANAALIVNPAQPITHLVQVQPIIVQQAPSEGGNAATFFGTAGQQAIIEGHIDTIWAQAGIDIEFLPTNVYVDSFAYDGFPTDYSMSSRPTSHLNTINSAAGTPPRSPNAAVLNMFFVDVVPGFSFTSENTANGLAFVDSNGVAQFVGDNLLTFEAGREVIASVVAHEIGHNLGLPHLPATPENLMQPGGSPSQGERINAAQVTLIMTDDGGADGFELLQPLPVPEPSTALLGLAAVALLGLRRQRR